jgi:spore coat polysaccharide biosynthesis predicted glycosyltransferase SpsG
MPSYRAAYTKAGKTLLGAAYTPLRSQFENKAITIRETASDILVTTGGSDPYHFCVEFIKRFSDTSSETQCHELQDIPSLHVVIGRLSEDREMLYSLAKEHSFIKLYENVTDMAALMSTCDLAVSAAGTTLYELCALGVPTVSFTMADNQLTAAKAFDKAGAIPWAGDIRREKTQTMNKIFDFIQQMTGCNTSLITENTIVEPLSAMPTESYQRRLLANQVMHSLADGNGAAKIARELAQL